MLPIALRGAGDFLAGNGDALAFLEAGESDEHKVFVVLYAFHRDVADVVFLGRALVVDDRVDDALLDLGEGTQGKQ